MVGADASRRAIRSPACLARGQSRGRCGTSLADHAPLLRGARADQIANDDDASGDAEPHVQRLLCGELADRVDYRQPGPGRPLGVVLMRLGIAEINEHAIAHIPFDCRFFSGQPLGPFAGDDEPAPERPQRRFEVIKPGGAPPEQASHPGGFPTQSDGHCCASLSGYPWAQTLYPKPNILNRTGFRF
jgi:hypothetical protein